MTARKGGAALARVIESCAERGDDPSSRFDDPQDIVDARDASYEARLALLQRWRSVAAGDDADMEKRVAAAIRSLEAGAVLGTDEPEDAPVDWGYGARSTR
jgi:hypothetical protein